MQHSIKQPTDLPIRPTIPQVLRAMQPGDRVIFDAPTYGSLSTAYASIKRANDSVDTCHYSLTTADNGATYVISCYQK